LPRPERSHARAIRNDDVKGHMHGPDVYEIVVSGRAMPLSEFHPSQTRAGISARPWAHRRTFPGTFFLSTAGEHVFARVGPERLPLHELWGPIPARELGRGRTLDVIRETAFDAFHRRFAHEFERLSGKGGSGGERDDHR
jgi:hypothetical protein